MKIYGRRVPVTGIYISILVSRRESSKKLGLNHRIKNTFLLIIHQKPKPIDPGTWHRQCHFTSEKELSSSRDLKKSQMNSLLFVCIPAIMKRINSEITIKELRRLLDSEISPSPSKFPCESDMQKRHMTKNQEIWNAITMIFTPLFSLYFIFSGNWITEENFVQANKSLLIDNDAASKHTEFFEYPFDSDGCISSGYFPNLHALPPWTTMSVVIGYMLHSPCSIYYHYMCAFKLRTAKERLNHWSRRLDQAMIHIMGVFIAFGTSGSIKFSLVTLMFSLDSAFRLFKPGFEPKSNQIRMMIAFIISILPMIKHGLYEELLKFLAIYGTFGWIFIAYPFGGYSHGIFHLGMALSNPIQLSVSTRLIVSQGAIDIASKCAIVANIPIGQSDEERVVY